MNEMIRSSSLTPKAVLRVPLRHGITDFLLHTRDKCSTAEKTEKKDQKMKIL